MNNHRSMHDIVERYVPLVVFGITLFLLGMLVVDAAYAIRAQPAQYACEAKRMDYRRISFSTTVICVPRSLDTRNDTLTIQR